MIKIGFIFGLAIYGIIWFLTLFMVLPWGVVSQAEYGEVQPGSSESAPARPLILQKLAITTGLSAVFYLIVYWLLTSGALSNIDLPFFLIFLRGNKRAGPIALAKGPASNVFRTKSERFLPKPENAVVLIHEQKINHYSCRCHPFFTFL